MNAPTAKASDLAAMWASGPWQAHNGLSEASYAPWQASATSMRSQSQAVQPDVADIPMPWFDDEYGYTAASQAHAFTPVSTSSISRLRPSFPISGSYPWASSSFGDRHWNANAREQETTSQRVLLPPSVTGFESTRRDEVSVYHSPDTYPSKPSGYSSDRSLAGHQARVDLSGGYRPHRRPARNNVNDEKLEQTPVDSAGEQLRLHNIGLCNPCVFQFMKACKKADGCKFCHLPHSEECFEGVLASKETRRSLRRSHRTWDQ